MFIRNHVFHVPWVSMNGLHTILLYFLPICSHDSTSYLLAHYSKLSVLPAELSRGSSNLNSSSIDLNASGDSFDTLWMDDGLIEYDQEYMSETTGKQACPIVYGISMHSNAY